MVLFSSYGWYPRYRVVPKTSGLPEISGNTRCFGLPATRWFPKLNRVGSGIERNTGFGYPLGTGYHSEWQWLLRKFWPQLIFKKARDILEGVKQTCPLHPLGSSIKHLYWNESKGNCYCRLESLKSKCRKFSFDNLKIQTLRRAERIPAWELLQSFSAPQVTRSTVTNQQKTAGEE